MSATIPGNGGKAGVCGCSSMVEQKLPKLPASPLFRTIQSKTRSKCVVLNQPLRERGQNKTAPPDCSRARPTNRPEEGRMAEQTLHEAMIAALVVQFPEVQTTGFFRELATVGDYMAALLKCDPEWRREIEIVPDAFAIDRVGRHVTVFEIVDTHDIPAEKIAKVEEIGWALDQDCYDIGIVRIDRHGRQLIAPIEDALANVAQPLSEGISQ